MSATYIHDGRFIDYTPDSDTPSGAVVVQGDLVGVAVRPIAANTLGSVAVEGVFSFPKATGADTAIAKGAPVYWHTDTQQANTTSDDGKLIGKSAALAGNSDEVVHVRLSQ